MTKLYRSANGYFFKYKTTDGCWKNKAVPVSHVHDETLAQAWADDWIRVYTTTGAPPVTTTTAQQPTLGIAADEWLAWKKTVHGGENKSWRDCERFVRMYLRPHKIARCTADQLNVPTAVSYVEWVKGSGVAPYTQRNIVSMMRQFVSDLRGKGFLDIKENPFADPYVKKASPKGAPTTGEVIVHLSPAQISKLLACPDVPEDRRAKYTVAYGTGLRAAEIAGLRWEDIDVTGAIPYIKVQRQRQTDRGGNVVTKPPKKNSYRTIPLHPRAAAALSSTKRGGDWVFDDIGGNWAAALRNDLASAGIPARVEGHAVTFHALRRSFMTALADAGFAENDIGVLAGHKSGTVTGKHYIAKNLPKFAKIIDQLPWEAP